MPSVPAARSSRQTTRVTIRAVVLLSGVLTVVFLISFVFSEEGISELREARMRVDTIEQEIVELERENAKLEAEADGLRESSFTVEKIAREDLGMSKPGEIVYRVPEP